MRLRSRNKQKEWTEHGSMTFDVSFNKGKKVTDEHLTKIFADIGRAYGYDEVYAEFTEFRDIKVSWQRSYTWISFRISDYLQDAPDHILQDLAQTLFRRLDGANADHTDDFVGYLTDTKRTKGFRKTYLERNPFLTDDERLELHDSFERLIRIGLIPRDMDVVIKWNESPSEKASGYSYLMRTVWVNSKLKGVGNPLYALDYALYSALCGLMTGYSGDERPEVERLCKKYPQRKEATDWLNKCDLVTR